MSVRTIKPVVLSAAIGMTAGIGVYTFVYAKGASYLTNDPAACANCHIMNEHYSGRLRSSHRAVAVCNDYHTPSGLVAKYATKVALINDIKRARESGRPDAELAAARDYQRKAQFYLDFVEAENSMGFHASQEAVRILGESINFSRLGQVELRGGPSAAPVAAAASHRQ